MHEYLLSLLGGLLIGIAVSLLLFWNGRVTGISGIVYGAAVNPSKGDTEWRWYFIYGLLLGGLFLKWIYQKSFEGGLTTPTWTLIVAGLLVGFGTILGGGCTSGHGVCGISRLSPRSIIATLTFIFAGALTVFLFRKIGVFP